MSIAPLKLVVKYEPPLIGSNLLSKVFYIKRIKRTKRNTFTIY